MKRLLCLTFTLIFAFCYAKVNTKIYYEKTNDGYHIYADNLEFCPVSIQLEFTVTNMRIQGGNNKIYVVEPNKKKQLLTTLTRMNRSKAYKMSYKSWTNYGNTYLTEYDHDFSYHLPFKNLGSHEVFQGYNGDFSHQNKNAIDFKMPIGTEVTVIREGIVVKVIDSNTKTCETKECEQFNNSILIYHPDGTFASYVHIDTNGSKVQIGDHVKQGDVIALSGNIGFSTGPHLHLEIFVQKIKSRRTLKTKFLINDGNSSVFLKEKEVYLRNY